jgi:PAS domain S-box-containing protein
MGDSIRAGIYTRGHMPRLAFLLLALLPIVANGVIAFVSLRDLARTSAETERSLESILLLERIGDLSDASGRDQRTYRVYGDPQLLGAYRKAQAEMPAKLQRLRDLVAEDGSDPDRLERVSSLITQDSAALAASLTPIEPGPIGRSLPPELATSIARTQAIGAAIEQHLDGEERLIAERTAASASLGRTAFASVVLGSAGSIALLGFIFGLMRRDLGRSERLAESQSGALRESEQLFRSIFEESPMGKVLVEPDGRHIVQANPAFCQMLGYPSDAMIGRNLFDLVHIDDRELLSDAVEQASRFSRDVLGDAEMRHVTHSGAIAWTRSRLTQLSGWGGRKALLLFLVRDITHEKRVEAELRQAQKMEAVGQLTGGIAHDFNNLLGVIIGNVEFLIDTARNPDQASLAKEILNSALSGADLTRRLLAFARRQTLQPQRIDLNAYLPNHIAIVQRLLGEQITIATTLADQLWPTRADPSQVGDALLNLAINARDAMPYGGTISIATANTHLAPGEPDEEVKPGDYVMLSVSDTGTGMPREVLDRALEPLFTTKEIGTGSGLGLSMIFGFAKQSGGHLRIESEPGLGTMVRLYLPRAQGLEVSEAIEATEIPLPQGNESILVVDDNTEMRSVARRHLISLGYRVSEAGSAPLALEILQDGKTFDLLFTDVVMPNGMTGHQLAAAAQRLRPGLKVLFTSGYFRSELDAAPVEAVAPDIMIRKPYRRHELAATVRAVLEA